MEGWIKIYRSIMDHWVYQDETYFRAWCTILMKVNYEPKKVLIHRRLFDCDRGQSLLSLHSWVVEFGVDKWSIQKVRTFFKMLEDDNMIIVEGIKKTTRLTVCNYDSYQNVQQTDNIQITHSQHTDNIQITTTKERKERKERKEVKNKKKEMPDKPAFQKKDFIDQVVGEFVSLHGTYQIINPGKERQAAGRLVQIHKKKYPDGTSEETLTGLKKYFEMCLNIDDPWYKQNMSLPLMVSKFNEINNILKNGKSTTKNNNSGFSDSYKRNVLERFFTNECSTGVPVN